MDFLHHWEVVWLKLSGKSSLKEKRNTSLLASRHIKREKASLPVDVRRSKTSLLKLPVVTTTGHTLEKQLPLPFRVKVKLYTKTKSKNITLPA